MHNNINQIINNAKQIDYFHPHNSNIITHKTLASVHYN